MVHRTRHPVGPYREIATARTARGRLSIHHKKTEPNSPLKNAAYHHGWCMMRRATHALTARLTVAGDTPKDLGTRRWPEVDPENWTVG